MSLMLNALKQIEAKKARPHRRPADALPTLAPVLPTATGMATEPIELPPIVPAADPISIRLKGLTSCPDFLETSIDQLQELVSTADMDASADPASNSAVWQASLETAEIVPTSADPHSMAARRILEQIAESRARVIVFTSPIDGQGKTMTVARLAPKLTEGRQGNVLVVDANFRNPDMARWFGVAPAWRLPEVIAGVADWASAVQVTSQARLSLLPGGRASRGSGLGWGFATFRRLFEDLAEHYDLVIVDSASLLHRGTVQLAAACDAAYMVVRLRDGSPRILREAADVLRRNGGRLLGCVAVDAG